MAKPMMKCGHAANATQDGKPVCAICANIRPGWNEVQDTLPDLTGRVARCPMCRTTTPSHSGLPFFAHHPERDFDEFYCGCRGWD